MALPEVQQALSVIGRSASILLVVPTKPSADALASMIAAYLALVGHSDKTVEAVSPSHVPTALQFLPGSSQVQMQPRLQPDVVLDVAGPTAALDVRQEPLSGGVRLHITFPAEHTILKENIEVHVRQMPYDAVLIFGAADLEELGNLFTNYADFFYNTPIINIDHRATNEHFGTVNLVDITASSVAEVAYELISALPAVEVGLDIATALYAGIVSATDSFQKPSTTPQAFQVAAELLNKKADKEAVIQHLVKTKPLYLLKLAGRTYARLRYNEHGQLFWSILRPLDFSESGASIEHIPDLMHELTNNISGYNAVFLLYQDNGQHYTVYLLLGKGLNKRRPEIQEQLSAKRENSALILQFSAPSIEQAERVALEQVQSVLP